MVPDQKAAQTLPSSNLLEQGSKLVNFCLNDNFICLSPLPPGLPFQHPHPHDRLQLSH